MITAKLKRQVLSENGRKGALKRLKGMSKKARHLHAIKMVEAREAKKLSPKGASRKLASKI